MNLMKWFRKHNRKIMAFVVIALMIVFTIQPVMSYLSSRRSGGKRVVAYYDDGRKISNEDLAWSQKQLDILKTLGIHFLLQPRDPRMDSSQDLRQILLGELLFSERGTAAESISLIRQIINRNGYRISDEQINDIYAKAYPPNMYWLLLTKEAQQAGIRTATETAKEQLSAIIPRLHQGATYSQVIGIIVEKQGLSEQQVLETFADLLGTIEFCRIMSSAQDTTSLQLLQETVLREETIDAEYVLFGADTFTSKAPQPDEEKTIGQFEKYKSFFADEVSKDNPYGFGYKLPDRVKLEYIAVRLDDTAATVQRPTQQEMEEYYQQHLTQRPIAYTAPSDSNDPNSQIVWKTRSYAEVAALLSRGLYQQRVDAKAEQILLDAKSITEVNLMGIDRERTKLTGEEVRKLAVDYEKTAKELSEKYKLKVYTGKTGLLDAADVENDKYLGPLYVGGTGFLNTSLSRVVFAVEPLKASVLGPYDIQPALLYENIGPLKDRREAMLGYSGSTMMLVRVIEAEKAAEPQSINEKINKQTVVFDQQPQAEENVNTIRDIVVEDLKRYEARDIAGEKAREFVREANEAGWDAAIEKFNDLYRKTVKGTEEDTNSVEKPFRLQKRTGLRRISDEQLAALATRYEGDPMSRKLLARADRERILMNELYALVPEDANTLAEAGTILEFKPEMNYYCAKSIIIHRLSEDEYDKIKAVNAVEDAFREAESLAAVYFDPKNIVSRMNFRVIKEQQETAPTSSPNDVNTVPEAADKY
ncbi:MAG: hypothetical protein ABII09_05905 [Planctomycetota bacterium]